MFTVCAAARSVFSCKHMFNKRRQLLDIDTLCLTSLSLFLCAGDLNPGKCLKSVKCISVIYTLGAEVKR